MMPKKTTKFKAGDTVICPVKTYLGNNSLGRACFGGDRMETGRILPRHTGKMDDECQIIVEPFMRTTPEDSLGYYLVSIHNGPVVLAHRNELLAIATGNHPAIVNAEASK